MTLEQVKAKYKGCIILQKKNPDGSVIYDYARTEKEVKIKGKYGWEKAKEVAEPKRAEKVPTLAEMEALKKQLAEANAALAKQAATPVADAEKPKTPRKTRAKKVVKKEQAATPVADADETKVAE